MKNIVLLAIATLTLASCYTKTLYQYPDGTKVEVKEKRKSIETTVQHPDGTEVEVKKEKKTSAEPIPAYVSTEQGIIFDDGSVATANVIAAPVGTINVPVVSVVQKVYRYDPAVPYFTLGSATAVARVFGNCHYQSLGYYGGYNWYGGYINNVFTQCRVPWSFTNTNFAIPGNAVAGTGGMFSQYLCR